MEVNCAGIIISIINSTHAFNLLKTASGTMGSDLTLIWSRVLVSVNRSSDRVCKYVVQGSQGFQTKPQVVILQRYHDYLVILQRYQDDLFVLKRYHEYLVILQRYHD